MAPPVSRLPRYSPRHRQQQHGPRAKNRTFITLLAVCLAASGGMNFVAVYQQSGKVGRSDAIEGYLRKFLRTTENGLMRGSSGLARHRVGSGVGGSRSEEDKEDDDKFSLEEVEEEEDEDPMTPDEDDENKSKEPRPVELGGPPPAEDLQVVGGAQMSDVADATVGGQNSVRNRDQSNQKSKETRPIEHGGPPPIEGSPGRSANHTLGGLSCARYGGPPDRIAEEMVYWSDVPSDANFASVFKVEGEVKYMTFEPDGGGWNNIRMAMETVFALAYAMGRTLVLPPEQGIYLLGKDEIGKQKRHFSFADFYHVESISSEHRGLDIITMEEFLEREAMAGRLLNVTTGEPSFPPDNNRTKWDGLPGRDIERLKEWLRNVALVPQWDPDRCLAAFPSSTGSKEIKSLKEMHQNIMAEGGSRRSLSAVPVDATPIDRMRDVALGRSLCIYDEEMQSAPIIHFASSHKLGLRLLVHFYAYLYFEDWKQDLWTKRFVRDHLRYADELQCAAARVVSAIRQRVRKRRVGNNTEAYFDSLHIRRGDFQYDDVKVDANILYEASKDELNEGGTIYVATDEKERDYFKVFEEHYDLCFLDDFKHLYQGLNTNYYGMLDQLIASKGRVFFGTYYSTFSGWINRMRGYYADKHKLEGHQNGTIHSFFFIPKEEKYAMARYEPLRQPFWSREFPAAWRDIDKGIGELSVSLKKTTTTPAIF